jgi:hypothetical protein
VHQKPKGASGGWRTKPPSGRKGLSGGKDPEAAACWAGPLPECDGKTGRRNGKWVGSGGNAPGAVREEKAPKGESQERCRCETEPART